MNVTMAGKREFIGDVVDTLQYFVWACILGEP